MLREPMDQSVRGGVQLDLDRGRELPPAVAALKDALRAAVARYIDRLPDADAHPFLGRKTKRFELSGLWSVKLSPGGHHVSHVHTEGWISSAYYAALPEGLEGDDHAGWLCIGRPPIASLARSCPLRHVEPKVGRLVLFPSYFWHGAAPFSCAGERLTVAFDVRPGGAPRATSARHPRGRAAWRAGRLSGGSERGPPYAEPKGEMLR